VAAYRYVVADVFTDTPLEGNPVAIFTDARGLDDERMARLARETNLSETVFVLPSDGDAHAAIRIFTPATELPFAGHPVLGTAFVLGSPMQLGMIVLATRAGDVPIVLDRDESGRIVFGRMSQPVPKVSSFADEAGLFAALGVERAELPVEVYDNGPRHVVVVLDSRETVVGLDPDLRALQAFGELGFSCCAGEGDTWKTRMFAPALGVAEDPATGSAAGPIVCHLARHGRVEWGTEIVLEQGVEIGRPSRLHARAAGGGGLIDSVEVGGNAVTVARGEFRL
jgi:trans-2,3-dihydro-3-hydroxyanthranilate isomerase